MKKAVGGVVAITILLAGCSSKIDANEKNFGAAVGQYLDKKGALCLNITSWPVDVDSVDLRVQKTVPTGAAGRMAALEAVGLAKSQDVEVPALGFDGKPNGAKLKVKRYTLTAAAKPFEQTKENQTDLCWGKKSLDKVVKWEGPIKFGDYQEADVAYLYKIDGVADWAKNSEFLVAFPNVGRIVDGKKAEHRGVKLTSAGWEAVGLNN